MSMTLPVIATNFSGPTGPFRLAACVSVRTSTLVCRPYAWPTDVIDLRIASHGLMYSKRASALDLARAAAGQSAAGLPRGQELSPGQGVRFWP